MTCALRRRFLDSKHFHRRKIGRYAYSVGYRGINGFPALECAEGGWVSVDTLLARDAFWQPRFANRPARGNPAEKSRRLKLLTKSNWAVGMRIQRYRLQFLGIKVWPLAGHLTSGEPWSSQPISIDVQIAELQGSRDTVYDYKDGRRHVDPSLGCLVHEWSLRRSSLRSEARSDKDRLPQGGSSDE